VLKGDINLQTDQPYMQVIVHILQGVEKYQILWKEESSQALHLQTLVELVVLKQSVYQYFVQ